MTTTKTFLFQYSKTIMVFKMHNNMAIPFSRDQVNNGNRYQYWDDVIQTLFFGINSYTDTRTYI